MSFVDVVSDPGCHAVANRLRQVELPDYVQQADDQQLQYAGGPHGYARGTQLPCGTKAACFMSYAFFLTQQDQLPATERTKTARNLDRFATLHGITGDVAKLAQYLGPDASDKTSAACLAQRLTHCGVEDRERQMPGELIRAARQLLGGDKTARDARFVRQWCFDQPFQRLAHDIHALKLACKDAERCENLTVLATKVAGLSQTRQLEQIDAIADALYLTMGHKKARQTRELFNTMPRHDMADVRVGRRDIPFSQLESKLADIALSTKLPVVTEGIVSLPVADWVRIVESCSPEQARQIHSLVG